MAWLFAAMLALAGGMGMSGAAMAQSADLAAALSSGAVGEQADGYMGVVTSVSAPVRKEVESINIKRRQAYTDLAGTIFNPPHWRGRAGATWTRGPLSASAFANYSGAVDDVRSSPAVRVGSQTTFDLALVYRPSPQGLIPGVGFALAVRNLLNDKPAYARPVADYYVNYDSTNQSAIGRFISVSLTKEW